MSGQRSPARPWYDLVIETIALKGWTKAQLSERSSVSRPAIDNWRTNPKPPQARSVNAVADALGIPRNRALRLAGIIGNRSETTVPGRVLAEIMASDELSGEEKEAVIEAVEARLAKERGEVAASAPAAEREEHRPASLAAATCSRRSRAPASRASAQASTSRQ